MSKNLTKLGILALLSLSFSCQKGKDVSVLELTKVKSVDSFRDSIFFSDISGMIYDGISRYYFVGSESSIVFQTDTMLSLVDTFGKKGPGPLEIETPAQVELYKNHLYINEQYNGRLVKFDTAGNALSSFGFDFFEEERFDIYEDKIYAFNSALDGEGKHPIAVYDLLNGQFINSFGQQAAQKSPPFLNRHNFVNAGFLVSVLSANIPVVEVYDLGGNLLVKQDFSQHPVLKARISEIPPYAINNGNYNTTHQVFVAADLSGDDLFLLFTDWTKEKDSKRNFVFQMSVSNTSIQIKRIFQLGEGWYESFMIGANNTLVAYEIRNGMLELYRLPN